MPIADAEKAVLDVLAERTLAGGDTSPGPYADAHREKGKGRPLGVEAYCKPLPRSLDLITNASDAITHAPRRQ